MLLLFFLSEGNPISVSSGDSFAVLWSRSRGAEIKLHPGARPGTEITNFGSGSSFFSIYHRLEEIL
jgi:hypothetical protein